MGVKESVQAVVRALLGVSAYQLPANEVDAGYPQLGSEHVDAIREALGGNIQPVTQTKLRWYLADLEACQANADAGNMRLVAQLARAMRRDGTLAGILSTRAGGLIRLPNTFYGDSEVAAELSRKTGQRSVFDEMCPPAELEALEGDGVLCGIGVAELVPVPGRPYPVLVRLDPEYLVYRWAQNRWYFQSVAGLLPITPGDGRWVLHVPGARMSPWNFGLWPALGRSFINKEHAMLHRANYSAKLANPARLAYAPLAATEAQRIGFFRKLLAWSTNTVLELPPGYEAKLLESNGRGIDVFQAEVDTSDKEIITALAGQTVTTDGGAGFANADIHRTIRQDLIKKDGESLAYTVNTQILPQYVVSRFGPAAITTRATMIEWDTSTPKELEAQARTLETVARAIAELRGVLAGSNRDLNFDEMATRFNIPVRVLGDLDAPAQLAAATPDAPAADDRMREAA